MNKLYFATGKDEKMLIAQVVCKNFNVNVEREVMLASFVVLLDSSSLRSFSRLSELTTLLERFKSAKQANSLHRLINEIA